MKVAYCIRENYKERGGGDVVQMLMTKKYLEKYYSNINVEIINNPNKLDESYDICHIFNFSTFVETNNYFVKAKSLNIKIVSSPIYWNYNITAYQYFSKYSFFKINKLILNLEIFGLRFLQLFFPVFTLTSKEFRKYCKKFLESSDLILPNSDEEYKLLIDFVKEDINRYNSMTVYNATVIDNFKFSASFREKYNLPKNYLLQVGRIEPIKNQMSVVKALKYDNTIPIVYLGKIFDENYFKALKKIADKRGNVFFIQEVPYDDVFDFYKNAHSHILPSLRESPGLVSLEAYSQGCNIICSKFPYSPFDSYFKEIGIPIDPLDLKSIRQGIQESFNTAPRKVNSEVIKKFSWDNTAITTFKAYSKVLGYDAR